MVTRGHVSVIWRDVTFCHGIWKPVLPGTTRHYPVLPARQSPSKLRDLQLSWGILLISTHRAASI
eukprot:201933-Amorphochlora_amoeboformis.AAC.1